MGPPLTWRGWFGARWWLAGQAMWPAGWVERPPLTWAFPPHVDAWQPRLGPNRLKPRPAGPFAHSAWGLAHLVHVSNTPPW
jgi:hypothetical protein